MDALIHVSHKRHNWRILRLILQAFAESIDAHPRDVENAARTKFIINISQRVTSGEIVTIALSPNLAETMADARYWALCDVVWKDRLEKEWENEA